MIEPSVLPLLAVFGAIARNGSFTGAARELGFTKSMVSAQLRKLESRYGVRLVERTTRCVRLTSAGVAAWAVVQRLLDEARAFEDSLKLHSDVPMGRLRIGAPHGLAAGIVAPVVAALVRQYPGLSIDLVIADELRDLVRDELDAVVRLAAPRDSAYVMRRLGAASVILVASPLLGLAAARRPIELERAPWVRHTLVDAERFTFSGPAGQKESVRPPIRASANTMDAFHALLTLGVGVGAIPDLHVVRELQAGTLVRICPGWVKRRVVVHALIASREAAPPVELFLDAMCAELLRGSQE
jgi:DNA-binding transcriptional LysR family regulator